MKRPRRNHSAKFKAKVALAALKGDKSLVELAEQFDVHANQITEWKRQLLSQAEEAFLTKAERKAAESGPSVKDLQAKIGQLTMENDFLGGRARADTRAERKAMIDREHALPVSRQAELLELSRSAVYYQPVPVSDADLALMRRIDELHLDYPFAGSRMLKRLLQDEGFEVGRTHVRTLMRRMGIEAIYRRPRTSRPHPGHRVFPYLLRGQVIDRPNHAWALDITYLPMKRGFVYLATVLDWASRRVLGWQLSNTLTADFCVEALESAIDRYGVPEIVNTDQGSQFTGEEFVSTVLGSGARLSMDGKGSWRDNVFIERFWRTVKYEEVYLRAYESVSDARSHLTRYLEFYNTRRPHSALDEQTPDTVYFQPVSMAA
ncbi:MAG: IS3 family transposase [Gammaproteobacteria bacterium]|nr:IS3 family transposase [Gammaproteobacteria bacterium]